MLQGSHLNCKPTAAFWERALAQDLRTANTRQVEISITARIHVQLKGPPQKPWLPIGGPPISRLPSPSRSGRESRHNYGWRRRSVFSGPNFRQPNLRPTKEE